MKRKTPVNEQIYKFIFPHGPQRAEDPPNWSTLVRKELARESRHESQAFYGEDYGATVLQPGLDYSCKSHRRRLSRFTFHAKLFKAIDHLQLTPWEIYNLCYWDCTAHARDVAQKKHPLMKLDDDTGDDIPTWETVEAERELLRATMGSVRHTEFAQEALVGQEAEEQFEEDDDEEGEAYQSAEEDVEMEEAEERERDHGHQPRPDSDEPQDSSPLPQPATGMATTTHMRSSWAPALVRG